MVNKTNFKELVLVTGANGEVGHGLIPELSKDKNLKIVAVDLNPIDSALRSKVDKFYKGSVTDNTFISEIFKKHKITSVFHLAAILSTGGEKDPDRAQVVNTQGTANILNIANQVARNEKRTIKFTFPSTIAVYGIPSIEEKYKAGKVSENQYNTPITMYGINKLYCEMIGVYYSKNYKMLEKRPVYHFLDFRCLRFPGIISALTIPSGGTSDYAPEMIHAAAQGKGYQSFVRPDTQIPFMVMPDAIKAIISLNNVREEQLKHNVYNVTSFSVKAEEIARIVNGVFPNSLITYKPDENRQKIVDSWPMDIDDSNAREDWGWSPDYDLNKSFENYLVPQIKNLYN